MFYVVARDQFVIFFNSLPCLITSPMNEIFSFFSDSCVMTVCSVILAGWQHCTNQDQQGYPTMKNMMQSCCAMIIICPQERTTLKPPLLWHCSFAHSLSFSLSGSPTLSLSHTFPISFDFCMYTCMHVCKRHLDIHTCLLLLFYYLNLRSGSSSRASTWATVPSATSTRPSSSMEAVHRRDWW